MSEENEKASEEETLEQNVSNEAEPCSEESEAEKEEKVNDEAKKLSPEEEKILELEKKLSEAEKERDDYKDKYLRSAADFQNLRKRSLQEKQEAFDYGNANLLKDLLDSLDNFDRTVQAAATATDAKSIADGVTMINNSLVSMLENKYNLTSYGVKGEEFNPDIHEAIGMQEGDVSSEQIAEVYLKGYKLKDRVIRHAKVMVIKPKA